MTLARQKARVGKTAGPGQLISLAGFEYVQGSMALGNFAL